MGLSPYPAASDGFLAFVVVNVPFYFSFLDRLLRSVLAVLAPLSPAPPPAGESPPAERFMSRSCSVAATDGDCRVCLDGFGPESPVRRLPCGHVFHLGCLDTWLRFRRATCPLCRSRLLPADGDGDAGEN